jgi:hypothetical protein
MIVDDNDDGWMAELTAPTDATDQGSISLLVISNVCS